ncbi:hypothetical protein BCV72DRAFT_257900 [Rhizopus microsporus var. microsporus]|uniref:Uncharacterized protein n=1 Tax=Rhizopus microsporus var. microsporus TaxID=86635 RepID=A0A1X0QTX7_RHIZD|nr:hypothetical protein BCV72DRAFT_257900 [Rhizopus microsporus var. microsporus]
MDEGSTANSFDSSAISTSSFLALGDRMLAAKSSVDSINWNDIHREILESLVEHVHTITIHTYSFSKFIFLWKLQDMDFGIQEYINKDFLKKYGYNFGEHGLYYDVKRNLVNHFKASYQLSRLFERLGLPAFSCFPLRRSWSPCYDITNKILCQNILGIRWSNAVDKLGYWCRVVNLDSKALKPFRGTIQTDGVVKYETTSYIIDLIRRNRQEISGRCVVVGPGKRDMLYCVHENSTPEQPKAKKYCRILQDLKSQDFDVVQADNTISVERFDYFLQARSEQFIALSDFYRHTITNYDNGCSLFRKIRLSAYFNKQRADQKLIQDLHAKFGEDAVFVMGNWSAPHARYHEPIRGLGFRRLLKKYGFQAYLIDEYKATPDRYRLWNRDAAACFNYMHILRGLRRNGIVAHRFCRVAVAPTKRRRRVDDQEQSRTRIRLDDDSSS